MDEILEEKAVRAFAKEDKMAERELTAAQLMDLTLGFTKIQALGAALDFVLFTKLSGGKGVNVPEAADLLRIEERPARALLIFCAALGLLERREDGRYYNSPLSEKFLVRGKPDYFGGWAIMARDRLFPAWMGLTEALKTNRPRTWKEGSGHFESIYSQSGELRTFLEGMHSLSIHSGRALAEALDFSSYGRLLDVGGGSGAYAIAVLEHHPHLRGAVFDLPSTLEVAQEKIAGAGLSGRLKTIGGDFFKEELPAGFDVHLLSMILHDWPPKENLAILQACFDALPSGGIVIISELMMDDEETGPLPAAQMAMNMVIENTGFNYTWGEYEQWLTEVGFRGIRRIPLQSPAANGVIVGSKP